MAPHSQFGDGVRPHLYTDDCKRLTLVRRRLSLTHDIQGRLIPSGLELTLGMIARTLEVLSKYSAFHLCFTRMSSSNKPFNSFHAAATNGRLYLSLPDAHSAAQLTVRAVNSRGHR